MFNFGSLNDSLFEKVKNIGDNSQNTKYKIQTAPYNRFELGSNLLRFGFFSRRRLLNLDESLAVF